MAELLTHPLPEGPLYVHFDTDILDSVDAPAMNYPEPNGPSMAVMQQLFERLAESDQVVAISVSAWNPVLDKDGRTKTAVLSLLNTLLQEDLV